MDGRLILIVGGARSGKTRFAQELAAELGQRVLLVVTAEARNGEMEQRIAEHRRDRPSHWRTLEVPINVGRAVRDEIGDAQVAILDCVSLLVSNVVGQATGETDPRLQDTKALETQIDAELRELLNAVDAVGASCVIVSNEVGSGLVPANLLGRVYRDLLGRANQAVARRADEVYLMVAGIPVLVKPPQPP